MKEEVENNFHYIQNKAKKQIIQWCLKHYDKYQKAPHLNIQDIFENEREWLDPAEEDITEAFLKDLSHKFTEIKD